MAWNVLGEDHDFMVVCAALLYIIIYYLNIIYDVILGLALVNAWFRRQDFTRRQDCRHGQTNQILADTVTVWPIRLRVIALFVYDLPAVNVTL